MGGGWWLFVIYNNATHATSQGTGSYCYRTVSDEYSTNTCMCREDGCNKGGRIAGRGGIVWIVIILLVTIMV